MAKRVIFEGCLEELLNSTKEFHIITVGASIISNAQKQKIAGLTGEEKVSDEKFWKEKLDDSKFINELVQFLNTDPKRNSAELNTFLRVVENKDPKNINVYLVSTKTKIGELCKIVLERFLKECKYTIFTGVEISGYFWESTVYDETFAKDEFKRDISELLDRLIYLAIKKKEEGFKVYFNPTGGLKAHVIACALAGFLTGCEVYYMHEEFKDVVNLPLLFYLPKGKEVELLQLLSDKKPRSGKEFKDLKTQYENEIKRLEIYGLVEVEKDEFGQEFRIKITNKGKLIVDELVGG